MSQTEVQLIKDAVIVNADVSNSAAIDVSKLSGVMPLAGGTFTNDVTFDGATAGRDILFDRSNNFLKFKDNAKISLGTDDDANLYYDGTNPILYAGTNTLRIVADNIHLEAGDFGDEFLRCNHDGSVDLYHDNSKKFETTSTGATVTGDLLATGVLKTDTAGEGLHNTSTNAKFFSNNSNDTHLEHASNNQVKLSFIATGSTYRGAVSADANAMHLLTGASGEQIAVKCVADGTTELRHSGSAKLATTSTGINISGSDTTGSNLNGDLVINNAAGTRYAVFDASHTKLNFSDNASITLGDSNDFIAFHDSSGHTFLQDQGNGALRIRSDSEVAIQKWDGSNNENMAKFTPDGAVELYHDDSKKFETLSDGVNVTGTLKVNGSALSGGKCIKQLATFTQNAFNTTNSAFSDVISVNYTPASASSLIVFDFTAANSSVGNGSGGSATLGIRLIKDSTTLINATNATDFAVGNGEPDRISSALLVRHMEGNSNTNQRTYKVQFNREAGNTNATLSNGLGIIIREYA